MPETLQDELVVLKNGSVTISVTGGKVDDSTFILSGELTINSPINHTLGHLVGLAIKHYNGHIDPTKIKKIKFTSQKRGDTYFSVSIQQ